ncbi:MAG TPA: hypothetical protein VHB50_02080 [Bryobacteraceae bacterium]|nr:hypothetical protein [Bryobacteraceae bacterium]
MTALCLGAFLIPATLCAQEQPPAPAPQQPAQTTPQTAPPPASGKKSSTPDYPDPRTLTVGIFYWLTVPGSGPDIVTGKAALGYETLKALGKDHSTPGIEVSLPITRTGELHFEGFVSKGDGNQTAPADTTIYGTSFSQGDFLATQYRITSAKLYLDDLLHPYKFPVARFRLKSLWEVQYLSLRSAIDAPFRSPVDSSGNAQATTVAGTRTIILPTFGLAAEYAITPHILFRAAASGFGLPHRADIWDAEATVSYRRKSWEIRGGAKALHFKSSPKNEEYVAGTLDGGFVGIRYHWQ